MASTYVNDLRLEEMATGENSGSWGTKTNTNLELIAEAFSYGTETIGNADTTITIADGTSDAARSFFLKISSSADLTTTRVITLAPNTVSKIWLIENATSGGQIITIKQGTGATVSIRNGQTKMIATNGGGSGGIVYDLLQDISIPDLFIPDSGKINLGNSSDLTIYHDGSNSQILDSGTGDLFVKNDSTIYFMNAAGDEYKAYFQSNGGCALYFDNSSKLATTTNGISVTGNATFADDGKAIFGAGSDLTIEHDGTNSTITNTTGHLTIQNTADDKDVDIQSDDGSGGTATYFLADGSSGQAKLYHNDSGTGTLRLNTSSDGIDINGHADIEGHFTATDGCTITTADNSTQLTLTSTDADASEGPRLDLKRDSASPAAGDLIGTIRYLGEDDGGAATVFGEIQLEADDVTDGSEDGEMRLMIRNNGNLRNAVLLGSTEVVFNESGDDVDLRIESDTETHAFFLQGSSGNVGIGDATPSQKLDVSGNIRITGGFVEFSGDTSTPSAAAAIHRPADNTLAFSTLNAEAMRIDSDGNLRVAKTSAALATVGHELNHEGYAYHTRDGGTALYVNRKSSDGSLVDFYRDSYVGSIGIQSTGFYIDGETGHAGIRFAAQAFIPRDNGADVDGTVDLGAGSARFDDVHATNGTINTSDRNEKQDIEELTDAEQRVAVACKGLLRKFRWKSAVAEKGEAARTHFGIIAQDLQAAFAAEGLDAGDYAMFISTTWWEHQVEVPAVEADEEKGIEASDAYTRTDTYDTAEEAPEGATQKTRLGVRYSELLAFIIAAI